MPTEERIRRAVDGLKSVYPLRSVRIFGSCAERRAAANSDLDLLVEFDPPAVSLVKRNVPKKKRTHISAGSCGADDQIRTGDLILTKDALYRLSYISACSFVQRKIDYTTQAAEKQVSFQILTKIFSASAYCAEWGKMV